MMKTMTLLFICSLFILSTSYAEDEFSFEKKDAQKLSETLKTIFQARDADDRGAEQEAKEDLKTLVQGIQESAGVGDLLKYPDAWFTVKEGTIDSSNRIFKSTGKGFKAADDKNTMYVDFTDITELKYVYFISLPKGYKATSEERFPVIIFLHPEIEGARKKVDKETNNLLKKLYSPEILDKYIVIAPVGPMKPTKKSRKGVLVDAGKNWEELDPGKKTAFVAIKLLMEQMVFDRSKVFVDGMGNSALSAFRYATWYPSFFAGVIGRDAPMAPLAMENVKNIPFIYLSTAGNGNAAAAKKWAESYSEGDLPQVTMLEDAGSISEPSAEAQASILEWLEKVKKNTAPKDVHLKTSALDVAGTHWLRIDDLNAGLNMKLDDDEYPYIMGGVDVESNTIALDSERVLKFKIFLNDKIVDLDKKVTVILNGKNRFEGKIERSLDRMVDLMYYNSAGDFEVYCNYLEISEEN